MGRALLLDAYTGHGGAAAAWPCDQETERPAPIVGRALAAPRSSASTDQLDAGDDVDSAPVIGDARDWRFAGRGGVGWIRPAFRPAHMCRGSKRMNFLE
jgi:hypothetical protein